ncbi:MAG: Sporulation-killing factor biosynthesis protein SkfC [Candidatus Omnitrophica bacterium ADurb.Bin205]|nr:MAG: Sporulation-killing factor biosynthesis protein SkfC [Candidatus Omnitrophica bacterium ADurb.Bin205]
MKIKFNDWVILALFAVLGLFLWYKFEYPRFSFIDLSFGRNQALMVSHTYLKDKGVDTGQFSRAIIFQDDEKFNRYFQHSVGIEKEKEFIQEHDFDLFSWLVRFFKESQKEEYLIYVSPRSGEVVRSVHLIEDTEARIDLGKSAAKAKAESFLRAAFGTDLGSYIPHEEKAKRYENRVEYLFSWEKKDVYIPWRGDQGGAKLLTEVVISGDEVREFQKNKIHLPDKFSRYVERQFVLGEYLYSMFYVILFLMLSWSISIVLKERSNIVPRMTRKWFYYAAGFLFVFNTIYFFNSLQNIFISYPTSSHLGSFVGLAFTRWLLNTGFLAVGFIMPGIAGEVLCNEVLADKKHISFFLYAKTSFLNRSLASSVVLGYIIWVIALGLQAAVFYGGQKLLGVWREWHTMTNFSSAYIPLFSAFVIGIRASLNEEINFRLFGIPLAKKYLKNSILAVILTSLIWGMGHTMYVIFPVWFRIIEVSLIGIFYGFIFMRFGIIPLIIAHYLFDVFWCSASFILGHCGSYLFYSSMGLLGLPLVLAAVAYLLNRTQKEKPLGDILNKSQVYNLNVLAAFITSKKAQGCSRELIYEELVNNNWDRLLVDLALKEAYK